MDYREYRFSGKEYVENCLLFLLGDAMISYLFYRSVPAQPISSGNKAMP